MSNTIYKKDLHDVALAVANGSKAYTDKKIEDLKWELGTYDLNVESDNTSALVKTMPSGTIKLNVNKIYGASEVSKNLYSYENPLTKTNVKTSDNPNNYIDLTPFLVNGTTYYIKGSGTQSGGTNRTLRIYGIVNSTFTNIIELAAAASSFTFSKSFTADLTTYEKIVITLGTNEDNHTLTLSNVILSKTDIPYEPYFNGIHNLELSGLKVEGANKWATNNIQTNRYLNVSTGATTYGEGFTTSDYIEVKPSTQYTITTYGMNGAGKTNCVEYDSNKTFVKGNTAVNLNGSATFTTQATTKYVRLVCLSSELDNSRLNLGSSDLGQQTYTSTTLPIDLTTIEDSGGNKLFADGSLKGYGGTNDELMPYKATKRRKKINLGDLTYTYDSSNTRFITSLDGAKLYEQTDIPNFLITGGYTPLSLNTIIAYPTRDLVVGISPTSTTLTIKNFAYTDETQFKNAMNGVYLEFDLATPIEVSIDWSSTLRGITGYSNGTITLQNTYNMDTTSEIDYLVEEVKA